MPQLALTLRLLLTVKPVDPATAVTLEQFTNGLTTTVLFIHLANNMSPTIFREENVHQLMFAVNAHGHHPGLKMMALMDASLSSLTLNTTLLTTTMLKAQLR